MSKTITKPAPAASAAAATDTPSDAKVPPAGVLLTPEGEQALREELARLRERHQHEFVERLREAREFGESSNNDDLLQIREEEAVLAARISRLSSLLATATVVREGDTSDMVAVGSTVVVEDEDSAERLQYRITGGHEPLEPNSASVNSPVGRALSGSRVGSTVEVELPRGGVRRLKVISVRHP